MAVKDPSFVERTNLLNMAKLSIKGLIESALNFGRTLDSDYPPLQQFFVVMEHCLKHGLKVKKSFLGFNKTIWGPLEVVEKLCPEAEEIATSVRDLPGLKTPLGRARAWLRLALMQKKMADYLRCLIVQRDLLSEFYEYHALLMEEEGAVIVGLLVGLNVIDANLCVKGEDLDSQVGVIDFSMYLKNDDDIASEERNNQITAILDQKNYVEELNRQLNGTVSSLHSRVDSLEKSNTKLIEELAIAKNNIIKLQEENHQLRNENTELLTKAQHNLEVAKVDVEAELQTYKHSRQGLDEMYNDARRLLREESQLRQDVENELNVQVSMKHEIELAMKLLEKDIHEKQDALIGLREQLEEVKTINVEMYQRMQGTEGNMKEKNAIISRLEEKTKQITATMKQLEKRLQQTEKARLEAEQEDKLFIMESNNSSDNLQKQVSQKEKQLVELEMDLKIEKEWIQTLQDDVQREKDTVSQLRTETQQINGLKKEFLRLQDEKKQMKNMCNEQEETLHELAGKLSESKLKIDDIQEANKALQGQAWLKDKDASYCKLCNAEFSLSRRKVVKKETESQTMNTSISTADAGCQTISNSVETACQTDFESYEHSSQKDAFAQWPEHELNFSGDLQKVAKDHTYHTKVSTYSLPLQVQPICESTPIKGPLQKLMTHMEEDPMLIEVTSDNFEETILTEVLAESSPEAMDESYSTARDNTKNDPEFDESSVPDNDSFSDVVTSDVEEMVREKKYIVFRSSLLALFRMMHCNFTGKGDKKCGKRLINFDTAEFGSCFEVKACCFENHTPIHWRSQPMIGKVSAGNLMVGSAILFSGLTFEKAATFAGFLGLEFISSSTFYSYQRMYLYPTIHEAWAGEQMNLEILLCGQKVRISGDGQCDSPGFSAKYCVYTVMDQVTGKILCITVVQVTECNSSVAMEKLALQKSLADLQQRGFDIEVLTTDRHVSIAKLMREDYKQIKHQFDVWHFARSIKKKVMEASKKKGCSELAAWSPSINNHLWWSSRTCEKSLQLLNEKWVSLLLHTTNKHHWIGYTQFHNCEHEPIPDDEQRRKKWLKPETPAHDALVRIVCDKTIKRDLSGLTEFTHTGALEVFHSNVLKYRPKLYHFAIDGMEARTILAALAHNENTGRTQARKKVTDGEDEMKGELRYKVECPKGRNEWVGKKIFEGMQYGYVYDMICHVLEMKKFGLHTVWQTKGDEMPKNIARMEAPPKAEVVARMTSRF